MSKAGRNNNKNRVFGDTARDCMGNETCIFIKMNDMSRYSWLILFLFGSGMARGQSAPGFYTSEAAAVAAGGQVYVSIKKYNPTDEELKKAKTQPSKEEMGYLQLPVFATNVSFFDKSFETGVYCFGTDGKLKWSKSVGYSTKSVPPPLAERDGFIYTGAGLQQEDKVVITKLHPDGRIAWQQQLDSLDEVDAVAVHQGKVNVLASFKHREKKFYKDNTFSYEVYPIYFFIQLDPATGAVLGKEYQMMGNYLSSIGFGHPFINTDQSYFLSKPDSAIFLTTANQRSGVVVSEKMPAGNKIQVLTAGFASYHYITGFSEGKERPVYKLFSNFYGEKKEYESVLPATWADDPMGRIYLLHHASDSVFSFFNIGMQLTVCATGKEGKTSIIKQDNNPGGLVVGAGLNGTQPFIIRLSGRTKGGEPGKLSLVFY